MWKLARRRRPQGSPSTAPPRSAITPASSRCWRNRSSLHPAPIMGAPENDRRTLRRVVVIGGGITGLAAAYRLHEIARERSEPLAITLLEGSSRLGGVIGTERRDGFVLEWGPDSFITDKPWALDLARRLGLEGELIGTSSTHRRSFVVQEGRLLAVPEGFHLLAPSLFWPFLVS